MEKEIPEYLRLHVEQQEGAYACESSRQAWRSFRRQFADATGWKVASNPLVSAADDTPAIAQVELEECDGKVKRRLERAAAEELATTFSEVYSELELTRRALRQREAELAACVPVTPRADEERHLAERLESILRGGAEAIGCQAAAVFLLDDATSQLKLRASWGLPPQKILEPPRELRGAAADLEALLGHAVVLENPLMMEYWRAPLRGGSAICLPVSTPTLPLGTMWLTCEEAREFTAVETNLMEIVAGRVAADLEREILIEEGVTLHQLRDQVERFAQSQAERIPNLQVDVDGWEVAGWSTQAQSIDGTMHDWGIAADGEIFAAMGAVPGTPLVASSTAGGLQLSLRCLMDLPLEINDVVRRLNEAMWRTAPGELPASIALAKAVPDKAACEVVVAGDARAYHLLAKEVRKLAATGPSIGADDLSRFATARLTLRQGQSLVLASPSFALAQNADGRTFESRLPALNRSGIRTARGVIEHLRAQWLTHCGSTSPQDATIVAVTRRPRG